MITIPAITNASPAYPAQLATGTICRWAGGGEGHTRLNALMANINTAVQRRLLKTHTPIIKLSAGSISISPINYLNLDFQGSATIISGSVLSFALSFLA